LVRFLYSPPISAIKKNNKKVIDYYFILIYNLFLKGDIMARNNLDLAMLITDEILNEFERKGVVHIPLDEHKYSFPLQDRIQLALEKIANEDMINDNTKSIGE
tara:strand:+ start:41 stop:349 length:309 start_codon:yes stop_codon:yes gene_type:complete